eukprot:10276185-Alexandrium_andersonii.AAC.1
MEANRSTEPNSTETEPTEQSTSLGDAKSLEALAGTARFQGRPQKWFPKLPKGAFCALFVLVPNLTATGIALGFRRGFRGGSEGASRDSDG